MFHLLSKHLEFHRNTLLQVVFSARFSMRGYYLTYYKQWLIEVVETLLENDDALYI